MSSPWSFDQAQYARCQGPTTTFNDALRSDWWEITRGVLSRSLMLGRGLRNLGLIPWLGALYQSQGSKRLHYLGHNDGNLHIDRAFMTTIRDYLMYA